MSPELLSEVRLLNLTSFQKWTSFGIINSYAGEATISPTGVFFCWAGTSTILQTRRSATALQIGSHLLRSHNSSRSTTRNRRYTRTCRCQERWSTRKTQLESWLLLAEASSTETLDWCPIKAYRRVISFQSRALRSVRCSIRIGFHNIRADFQTRFNWLLVFGIIASVFCFWIFGILVGSFWLWHIDSKFFY